MFKRLKNWLFNRPPEDHVVASFGWVIGTFAAVASAVAFPSLAPIALGVANFASFMALAEGAYGIGGMIGNFCNWVYRKIFKSKKQPANNQNQPSKSEQHRSQEQEKTNDKGQEKSQTEQEKINDKGQEKSQPEQEKTNDKGQEKSQPEPVEPKQRPTTSNSKELLILIKQMQILMQLLQQIRIELEVLQQKNMYTALGNKNSVSLKQFRKPEMMYRPVSRRRKALRRNYLQNSRFVRH